MFSIGVGTLVGPMFRFLCGSGVGGCSIYGAPVTPIFGYVARFVFSLDISVCVSHGFRIRIELRNIIII